MEGKGDGEEKKKGTKGLGVLNKGTGDPEFFEVLIAAYCGQGNGHGFVAAEACPTREYKCHNIYWSRLSHQRQVRARVRMPVFIACIAFAGF